MSKIWRQSTGYNLLHAYSNFCVRNSFSSFDVYGSKNIPQDAAVIVAPNHCNTLMDALVMLAAIQGPSAYGARADIFKKKKLAAILRWLRMLPMARERDGLQAVTGNLDTFDEVVDCIGHGTPFCIFPEGKHTTKRSLQPLKKGVLRIAFKAARAVDKPVYIVPAGLEYGDYFTYMRPLEVRFGEPINISQFIADHPDKTDPEMFTELTRTLYAKISELITYFPCDENYDEAVKAWELSRKRSYSTLEKVGRCLLSLVSLPLFAIMAVLSCPMWITSTILSRKLKDKAWLNTMRLLTKIFMLPLLEIIAAVLGFILMPWYWAVVLLVALAYSHGAFFRMLNFYRDLFDSLKN